MVSLACINLISSKTKPFLTLDKFLVLLGFQLPAGHQDSHRSDPHQGPVTLALLVLLEDVPVNAVKNSLQLALLPLPLHLLLADFQVPDPVSASVSNIERVGVHPRDVL